MYQVRLYDGETLGCAHTEWHPMESTARKYAAECETQGLIALVLPMPEAMALQGMMKQGEVTQS